jgi:hypothetical protein
MHKQSTGRFLLTLSLEVSLVYEARFLSPGDAGRYYPRRERPCCAGLTSKLLFCALEFHTVTLATKATGAIFRRSYQQ